MLMKTQHPWRPDCRCIEDQYKRIYSFNILDAGHRSASQGVVSGEFATGNGLTSSTAPIILSLCPAGAKLTSTGEVTFWGYLCDPMSLREKAIEMAFSIEEEPRAKARASSRRRGRGTHVMVATLKRPPPVRRTNDVRWQP